MNPKLIQVQMEMKTVDAGHLDHKIKGMLHKKSMPKLPVSIVAPKENDISWAETVSNWTKSTGNMLPKTKDEILALFKGGHSLLIVSADGEPITHVAITQAFNGGMLLELGALYTAEEYRRPGICGACG